MCFMSKLSYLIKMKDWRQYFPKFNVQTDSDRAELERSPPPCISDKLPGDAKAAGHSLSSRVQHSPSESARQDLGPVTCGGNLFIGASSDCPCNQRKDGSCLGTWAMFREVCEKSEHLCVFPGLSVMVGRGSGIQELCVNSFSAQRQCYKRPG